MRSRPAGFADAFWLGFYVLVAVAALNPAMAKPVEVRESVAGRITTGRLAMLCMVTLAVPVIDLIWGEPFDKALTTTASMLMFVLVLTRLMGLMNTIQIREGQARHDALHDSLTGLANRVLFSQRLDALIQSDSGTVVSVLFVDLDDFKTVNDSLGHHAGDELLVEVASRLTSCIRTADTVARLGGDEFAVLLASAVDQQDAVATAHRMLEALSEPIVVQGHEVVISASVGIAVEPRSGTSMDLLLRGADAAMYIAKEKGKGRFEFFEQQRHSEAVDRLELRRDLQTALERDEFEIVYQPIFDIAENRVHSVEALLRWNHPTRGQVQPDRFIGLAEQSGLIVPIGRWVLREASAQVKKWSGVYSQELGVAVNLSVRQLHDAGFLEDVADALRLSGLAPECLTLEITESMLIEDTERGARALEQLKALKVRIAIDDFGTGYSSLSYLRRFPFDTIKIDRSFVSELASSATSEALVRTVIELAQSLKMVTVAEGVEHHSQWTALSNLACSLGQGYFFSRPLEVEAMTQLLEDRQRADSAEAELETTAAESAAANSTRAARRNARRLDIEIHEGADALLELRADLDDLHDSTGLPLMARMTWLNTWADVHKDWAPRAVIVRERGRGQIEGAALLAMRKGDELTELVGMGHGWASCTRFPIRSPRVARPLAKAIANQVKELGGTWRMELQQIAEGDPVAKLLAQQLTDIELLPELWVPRLSFAAEDTMDRFVSKNLRRQLKKAQNRIDTDGLVCELSFESSFPKIELALDELQAIHRSRDHASGRTSDLDDPHASQLWRELVIRHARAGFVELALLRLDGTIAGFVIALRDGRSYRVFDGHFDTEFARYSPGRIVEAAAVERAMADGAIDEVDWMSGVAANKILAANAAEGRIKLVAGAPAAKLQDAPVVGLLETS